MKSDTRRSIRATLRTALTWGAAWAVAGAAMTGIYGLLFAPGPGNRSFLERLFHSALWGAGWGVRFAVAGTVIGAVFSTVVRFRYRGRRVSEIDPLRFALVGALAGGVGVPLFLQLMNILSGDGPIAWRYVLDDARWATVFGAAVAGGSILLARRATSLPSVTHHDEIERAGDLSELDVIDERQPSPVERSRFLD